MRVHSTCVLSVDSDAALSAPAYRDRFVGIGAEASDEFGCCEADSSGC